MSQKILILARHGNTFEYSHQAKFVGSAEDIPLTSQGRNQANNLANYLRAKDWIPQKVYAASLKRTYEFADIICKELALPAIENESKLLELDYGDWGGLGNEEIIDKFGAVSLENWIYRGVRPNDCNWSPAEDVCIKECQEFIDQCYQDDLDVSFAVSSNGRLKYLLRLFPEAYNQAVIANTVTVKTGNICILDISEKIPQLLFWNISTTLL